MLKRILPDEAQIGMFVHSFDGKWLSHPFWRKRFVLDSEADVQRIRDAGLPLHIDTDLGLDVRATVTPPRGPRPAAGVRPGPATFGRANRERAAETAQRAVSVVRDVFNQVGGDAAVELESIATAVSEVAAALDYDPAIFLSATRLRAKSEQLYIHSVAVCALSMTLGNTIGLSDATVRDLGMGALLHDIGKLALPDALLDSPDPLTNDERAEQRRHPVLGHDMLRGIPGVPAVVLDICLHHHECIDGSGFPDRLAGDAIAQPARIVAICNAFDTLTSTIGGRNGLTSLQALSAMAATEDRFDPTLLFALMLSLGVFPNGTLVRLRSKRLAIAMPRGRDASTLRFRAFYSTVDATFIGYEDVITDADSADGPVSREDADRWFAEDWPAMRTRIMDGLPPPTSSPIPGHVASNGRRDEAPRQAGLR